MLVYIAAVAKTESLKQRKGIDGEKTHLLLNYISVCIHIQAMCGFVVAVSITFLLDSIEWNG